MRFYLALWAGKLTMWGSRLFGWGGSSLPGRVARRIDPRLLTRLSRQTGGGNLMISGTNGKTTTAKMISEIASASGLRLTHNRAGANLITGLTTAFLQSATAGGRISTDLGLLEVDEATVPRAAEEVGPKAMVVTNFFRDQLDRYGELEHTVRFIRRGLERMRPESVAVLNADDPLVANLGRTTPTRTLYYGIDVPGFGSHEVDHTAEAKHCVVCGEPYQYEVYYYAHLGKFRCPNCGNARPEPQVVLTGLTSEGSRGSRLTLRTPQGEFEAHISIPGLYNVYNALAATAAASALGISLANIKAGLESFSSHFGRMEMIPLGDKEIFLALVKNPVGFNEVIRTINETPEQKTLLIPINDNYADGTDISWLWDVDFEMLVAGQEHVKTVIASGQRAEDMALRLKYAGIDVSRIRTEGDLRQALQVGLGSIGPGEILYILPTYTAMLEMREILQKMGYARKFWEV
ncbi:MAG: Mur ligase family protein [Firmicutes bacterium]|nr:Mur ligase family protein [Bacillota bacterium]